jgi:phage regulator Rha-like protein
MSNLVFVEGDVIFITSIDLAKGVGHSHNSLLKLLRNSQDLDQLRDLKSKSLATKGRTAQVFYLTEEQATLLITLMKNTPTVRQFKSNLVKEFYKMRNFINKQIIEKNNQSHIEARKMSIQVRHQETDWIKHFVEYATEQGSKNAHMYYTNISKMENKALFLLDQKVKNVRDLLDVTQLSIVQAADVAVMQALQDGINSQLHYKEIYQEAKKRVEHLAQIFSKKKLAYLP